MKKVYKIVGYCLLCLAFIGCDRVTKDLAKTRLKDQEPLSFFHDTVRLTYTENTGAFLSLGAEWPQTLSLWLLTILPLLFLLFLFVTMLRKPGKLSGLQLTAFTMIFRVAWGISPTGYCITVMSRILSTWA